MRWNDSRSLWLVAVALALSACAISRPLPDDGFIDVPGGRVAFRVLGEGRATPVLMIHGGPGGTSCSYADTMGDVAATRPVVMYDQLGSGNSDRMVTLERDATLQRFVAEVVAIREQLGLEEVHLVGHSWGATVALEYLLSGKREGVRSVSFVGPLISTPVWVRDANALVETLPAPAREAIRAAKASGNFDTPEFEAANTLFEQQYVLRTPRGQRPMPTCISTPVRFNEELYEYMWGPAEFVANGTLRDYDPVARLRELDLPVMFLAGEHDEARPGTMQEFQKLVPGSVVKVIPGAAHSVNVDQTEAFNVALAEFLSSVDNR